MKLPENYVSRKQLDAVTSELVKMVSNTELSAKERLNAAAHIYTSHDRWVHHQLEAATLDTVEDLSDAATKSHEALEKIHKLKKNQDRKAWEPEDDDEEG